MGIFCKKFPRHTPRKYIFAGTPCPLKPFKPKNSVFGKRFKKTCYKVEVRTSHNLVREVVHYKLVASSHRVLKIETTVGKSRDEKKFRVGYNTDINKKHRERSMNEQGKRIIKQ